eukprot:CAMPEP_0113651468 /NCGR_PEP_ID=MMETSP0017_2-20120614/27428_1 /TAXON_ID=2856 /ORGANISM="Cylindrotheca closterium" /LENGTH=60 /DNA_ID=CAMNT_0000564129 /DNA_START=32 /DNA_END=214 /DNA_ORIENTATION=- /assembly_acc=CAM_ASM_000147
MVRLFINDYSGEELKSRNPNGGFNGKNPNATTFDWMDLEVTTFKNDPCGSYWQERSFGDP